MEQNLIQIPTRKKNLIQYLCKQQDNHRLQKFDFTHVVNAEIQRIRDL